MCAYVGGSLVDLVSQATVGEPTRRLLRKVADAGGEALTEAAAANTPRRTGETASKWEQLPVRETEDGDGMESGATNRFYKARWLEHGVKPHELRPKRQDALDTPEGPRGGVHHPGVEAYHPLARAAAEVEAALPVIAQRHLDAWAAEIEQSAKRHKGIE